MHSVSVQYACDCLNWNNKEHNNTPKTQNKYSCYQWQQTSHGQFVRPDALAGIHPIISHNNNASLQNSNNKEIWHTYSQQYGQIARRIYLERDETETWKLSRFGRASGSVEIADGNEKCDKLVLLAMLYCSLYFGENVMSVTVKTWAGR